MPVTFRFYVSSRETQQHTGKSGDQSERYGSDARVRQPETFHCFSRETAVLWQMLRIGFEPYSCGKAERLWGAYSW